MMNFAAAAVLLIGGALSGLLSFGVYGKLRDRGWGAWKAGAVTGAIGGAMGALALLVGGPFRDKLNLSGLEIEPLNGLTIDQVPQALTGLTIQRLSGLPQINGMGLQDLQIGAVGVDPRTMQAIGAVNSLGAAYPKLGMLWDMDVY